MAQLVIKDILGSDNVAASRAEIASNFKILCDGINKIETYLNTSPNGGSLNIATLTVKKYSRPITDVILNVEASVNIAGNLVLGTTGSGTTLTINSLPIFNYNTIFKKDVIFDKLAAGNTVSVKTKLSIEDLLIIPVKITNAIVVDGNDIPVDEVTNLNLSWDVIDTGSIKEAILEEGVDGQILIIRNLGTCTDFSASLTLKNIDATTILEFAPTSLNEFENSKIILQFVEEAGNNRWEVISIVGVPSYVIG